MSRVSSLLSEFLPFNRGIKINQIYERVFDAEINVKHLHCKFFLSGSEPKFGVRRKCCSAQTYFQLTTIAHKCIWY